SLTSSPSRFSVFGIRLTLCKLRARINAAYLLQDNAQELCKAHLFAYQMRRKLSLAKRCGIIISTTYACDTCGTTVALTLIMSTETHPTPAGATMTIRDRIAQLTAGCKTQLDLDRAVSSGALKTLRTEYPNADPSEVMYYWDARK